MLQYGPSLGFLPMREWLAEWQGVTLDQVLTGNGSLQLVEFLCHHVLQPGDVVFTESPTYDRTITLLRRHGARWSASRSRPTARTSRPSRPQLAKQTPVLFYLIPDFQNPAGATCSGAKRRRLVGAGRQARLPAASRTRPTVRCATAAARSRRSSSWPDAHAAHELVHRS